MTQSGSPHGKPSSWVLVGVVTVAFSAGGAALILHLWWLLWACIAVVVLSVPVGKVIGLMEDTVGWTLPMSPEQRRRHRTVIGAAEAQQTAEAEQAAEEEDDRREHPAP